MHGAEFIGEMFSDLTKGSIFISSLAIDGWRRPPSGVLSRPAWQRWTATLPRSWPVRCRSAPHDGGDCRELRRATMVEFGDGE